MTRIAYILLALPLYAFSQTDSLEKPEELKHLKYYSICHERLEDKINQEGGECELPGLPNLSEINGMAKDLKISEYLRYYQREQAGGENIKFLEDCSKAEGQMHAEIGLLAKEAYDISFLDREKPNLENNNKGLPPNGYKVEKYYGNNPEECFQTGLKAALFVPPKGDHVVFAITGTEGKATYSSGKERETYISKKKDGVLGILSSTGKTISAKDKDKEDWIPTGEKQFSATCMEQIIRDATVLATKQNKKIYFTGHSLGGALSEAAGHVVQRNVMAVNPNAEPVNSITFMSAGGRKLTNEPTKELKRRYNNVAYVSLGDIVSGWGSHGGEIREMIRKDEYEEKFRNKELPVLDTHSLELSNFRPLNESMYITGQDFGRRYAEYGRSLNVAPEATETTKVTGYR
jgi:hypothetical protein